MTIAYFLKDRTEGAKVLAPSHPRVSPLTVQSILAKRPSAVCCVDLGMEVLTVLHLMAKRNVASVLVMNGGSVAGVFSEREYCHVAAVEQVGSIPVGAAMIPCDVTISPEDSAHHCMGVFTERQLRYLPVAQGTQLIDVLSLEELLGSLAVYYQRIIMALELDQQVMFLRGTYSC